MIWLLACNTTSIEKQHSIIDQTQAPPEDTAFVSELEEEETISKELIETTLQAGINKISTVRAHKALDVYDAILTEASETCPRWYTGNDGPYWSDDCQTSSGFSYQGFGLSFDQDGTPDEAGNIWTGRQIHCEGILESSAAKLTCVGGFNELVGIDANEHPVFYSYTSPYTLTENGTQIIYPQMEMWAVDAPEYRGIYYSGTILVETGIVQFDEMSFNNADCTLEPAGKQNVQVS